MSISPSSDTSNRIVVGVTPAQAESVLRTAAGYAQKFDASLECVLVDADQHTVVGSPGSNVAELLLAPSDPATGPKRDVNEAAKASISRILEPFGVAWDAHALVGRPAEALASFAEELDASMIVIGARRPGIAKSVAQFLNGSVAEHLLSRQNRPVVVVPLNPVRMTDPVPWEQDDEAEPDAYAAE